MKPLLCIFSLIILTSCLKTPPNRDPLAPAQALGLPAPNNDLIQLNQITSQNPPYQISLVSKSEYQQKKVLQSPIIQRRIDELTHEWLRKKEEWLRQKATGLSKGQIPEFNATVEFIMPPSPCPDVIPFSLHTIQKWNTGPEQHEETWINIDRESGKRLTWNDLWSNQVNIAPQAVKAAQKKLRKKYGIDSELSENSVFAAMENSQQFLITEDLWFLVAGNDLHNNFKKGEKVIIPIPYRYLKDGLLLSCE